MKDEVPKNYSYYNLVDSSFDIRFNISVFDSSLINKLKRNLVDFPFDSFSSTQVSNGKIGWRSMELPGSNVKSYSQMIKCDCMITEVHKISYRTSQKMLDSLNQFRTCDIYVPVRKTWKRSRVDKERYKIEDLYFKRIKLEDKEFFRISTPIQRGKYAIIEVRTQSGACQFLYKYENHIWKRVLLFYCSVS